MKRQVSQVEHPLNKHQGIFPEVPLRLATGSSVLQPRCQKKCVVTDDGERWDLGVGTGE